MKEFPTELHDDITVREGYFWNYVAQRAIRERVSEVDLCLLVIEQFQYLICGKI